MTFADLTPGGRMTLLLAAVRYALGRSTWMGRDVAELTTVLAGELDVHDAKVLVRDIEDAMVNVRPGAWAMQWTAALAALRRRAYWIPAACEEGPS